VAKAPIGGYLPTLDGWRAIAILAVLLDHAVGYSPLQSVPRVFALTRVGPNGVSLFFAISGFLICSRLLEEERAYGVISLRGFYVRRACRILPPAGTVVCHRLGPCSRGMANVGFSRPLV